MELAAATDKDRSIGLDVGELAAELEGVLALQNRDAVLEIIIRVGGKILGTIVGRAQDRRARVTKTTDNQIRHAARQRIRYASVDGVALTIGWNVHVEIDEVKRYTVVAHAHLVHYAGAGGVDPAGGIRPGAYRHSVRRRQIREGVIFSRGVVVAVEEHAVDRVLVVHVIVDLGDSVVADVGSGERAEEVVIRTNREIVATGARRGAASARDRSSCSGDVARRIPRA